MNNTNNKGPLCFRPRRARTQYNNNNIRYYANADRHRMGKIRAREKERVVGMSTYLNTNARVHMQIKMSQRRERECVSERVSEPASPRRVPTCTTYTRRRVFSRVFLFVIFHVHCLGTPGAG